MQKEEVEAQVLEMQDKLTTWYKDVSKLRARYPWLLYFGVPKILLLYKAMKSSSMEEIVHEVSFLVIEGKECMIKKVEVMSLKVFWLLNLN